MAQRLLMVLLLGVCASVYAQIVELPREIEGVDRVVATSWQVEHPVTTGVLSGLTLGVWPERYGDDVATKAAVPNVMNQGLGLSAFEYSREAAYHAFTRWRAVGAFVSVPLIIWALVSLARRWIVRRRTLHV